MSIFHPTEEIIKSIAEGKMVIIVDEEDRENEGDLIMAAQFVTSEHINFMAKYARGLICLPLTSKRCSELDLALIMSKNHPQATENQNGFHSTNFTVSIDAKDKTSTGISASDRAITVQGAINPSKTAKDFIQPGHIFPLIAKDGGVLTRAGHTEAGCDLARLAKLNESAVIVEIMNEDGTMARRDDLVVFAKKHNLKIGSIADLVKFRLKNEVNIKRLKNKIFEVNNSDYKLIPFQDKVFNRFHFAYVKGNIKASEPTYVRVHVKNTVSELSNIFKEDYLQLDKVLEIFKHKKNVVVVVLRDQSEENLAMSLKNKNSIFLSDDIKTYGIGAQILADLGVGKMIVLGAERPMQALKGFSLEIIKYMSEKE